METHLFRSIRMHVVRLCRIMASLVGKKRDRWEWTSISGRHTPVWRNNMATISCSCSIRTNISRHITTMRWKSLWHPVCVPYGRTSERVPTIRFAIEELSFYQTLLLGAGLSFCIPEQAYRETLWTEIRKSNTVDNESQSCESSYIGNSRGIASALCRTTQQPGCPNK